MKTNLEKLIEFAGRRPIEEAPKDGSEVLLTWSYLYPGDAHKTTGQGFYNWNVKDAYWEDEEGKHDPELFTHYMPLDTLERLAKITLVQDTALRQCTDARLGALEKALIARRAVSEAEQIAGGE